MPLRFVRDLLDSAQPSRAARPETETLVHEILDMMACKAAVKAGDPLSHGPRSRRCCERP
jgi:DNA mismatch repair ATPase MutL